MKSKSKVKQVYEPAGCLIVNFDQPVEHVTLVTQVSGRQQARQIIGGYGRHICVLTSNDHIVVYGFRARDGSMGVAAYYSGFSRIGPALMLKFAKAYFNNDNSFSAFYTQFPNRWSKTPKATNSN